MSLDSTTVLPTGAAGFSFARVLRLARKELRETLRDRRTIITLVLMPLLVYPVLGLAFHQFLLSSFQRKSELFFNFGLDSRMSIEERGYFRSLIWKGDERLQARTPTSIAGGRGGGPLLGADLGESEPSFQNLRWNEECDDLERSVHIQEVDLGIRPIHPRDDVAAQRSARQIYQLVFRAGTPVSRQAASYIERRLQAANEVDFEKRLEKKGDDQPPEASWRLKPVAEEKGHSFWLGTLVPLVLILMTVTGAVYPAIDLTAGERERGTLESLMAAPVPRVALLIAKYIAVVTVAMLTAVVNLTGMTAVIALFGLGPTLFGDRGLAPQAILAVLILLVLFAAFFSAVLLLITSFARSFKEAQAYVVPLMVVALAPGFMSVMPGWELDPFVSVMPLANMVLLARDVLEGDAPLLWGLVAVLSTILYGGAALAMAARVFGSDAILYGSEGSWGDLFRRPRELKPQPAISDALASLAIVTPLYIITSGLLAQLRMTTMVAQLLAAAAATAFLFIVVPFTLARLQNVQPRSGFQLHRASPLALAAAVVLGCTLWPLAYDLIILCQNIGIATFSAETLAQQRPLLLERIAQFRAAPPWLVLFAIAVAPAIGEEFFFRGYLLGALRGKLPAWAAICLTGAVFGLFHASVGGLLAVERILSSTLLGLALGWVCWKSGSVFPGIVLHVLHNGLMLSLIYFGPSLQAWGWDIEGQSYLPLPLLVVTTAAVAAAIYVIAHLGVQTSAPLTASPAGTPSPTGRGGHHAQRGP